MWHSGKCFSAGSGRVRLMVGLHDCGALFQPYWFCDSLQVVFDGSPVSEGVPGLTAEESYLRGVQGVLNSISALQSTEETKSCKQKLSVFQQSSLSLNHGKVLRNWKLRLVIFAFRPVPQFSFNLMLGLYVLRNPDSRCLKKCLRRMESINGEQLVSL